MQALRPSSAAMPVALAIVVLGAGGITATLGAPQGRDEGLVVFSAPGTDAHRLSVAASNDSRWRPTAEDGRPGGGHRTVVPLRADDAPFDLQPGGAVTVSRPFSIAARACGFACTRKTADTTGG